MVQLVKRCLRKIVLTEILNYYDLETLLVQIEGVVNDRPLTKNEEDPSKATICPSNLILGRKTNEVVESTIIMDTRKYVQKRNALLNYYMKIFGVYLRVII